MRFHSPLPPVRPHSELAHELEPFLTRLARIKRRRQLSRDPLYRRLRPEIDRVLAGVEWRLADPVPATQALGGLAARPARPFLRAVAWNIERGKRFDGIRDFLVEDPVLREADLLLLSEVDIGMARSGARNVARELAAHLGMSYVYVNGYLLLSPGDKGERANAFPSGLSLHGNALLSRHPITRFVGVALPEYRDRFEAFEKRLGQKRALVAEVLVNGAPVTVVVVHTDPFSTRGHRASSVRRVLDAAESFGNPRVLFGGDLNTNTYDLGSPLRLGIDAFHKGIRFGFHRTIESYMAPERFFERKLFRHLAEHQLSIDGVNDPTRGTIYYDTADPALRAKSRQYMPAPVLSWLDRRLEPWGGLVPMRVDWFAVRNLTPQPGHLPDPNLAATTCVRPTRDGALLSDHDPIVVDLALPGRADHAAR